MRSVSNRFPRCVLRHRRGSVLILVVVMVVLLALLGTALLSTSRGDRYTSTQHVANTQIDLLVDGVVDLAKAKIAGSLTGTSNSASVNSTYRSPTDTKTVLATGNYVQFVGIKNTNVATDLGCDWLSSRTPTAVADAYPPTREYVYWQSIGAPLAGDGFFESPIVQSDNPAIALSPRFSGVTDRVNAQLPTAAPTGVQFAPTALRDASNGAVYPAFHFQATGAGVAGTYMAADADGDGIADSGYFRLPVGTLEGLTYFAAVKIVDNNSMINLNTSGSRAFDRTPVGAPCDALGTALTPPDLPDNLGWFHSHVGLKELFARSDVYPAGNQNLAYTYATAVTPATQDPNSVAELLALNRYRLGYDTTDNALTSAQVTGSAAIYLEPTNNGTKMGASQSASGNGTYGAAAYLTSGDNIEHQIAERLRHTSYNVLSTTNAPVDTRVFDASSAAALAYHGGVAINTDSGISQIENTFYTARKTNSVIAAGAFADSIYSSAANYSQGGTINPSIPSGPIVGRKGYSPANAAAWFNDNYYADANAVGTTPAFNVTTTLLTDASKYRTLRPYVTSSNPTSQLIPARPFDSTRLPAFVTPPGAGADQAYWTGDVNAFAAYRKYPSKTSVNTATFDELWRAYWNVMAEGSVTPAAAGAFPPDYVSTTPFDKDNTTLIAPTSANIYDGEDFVVQAPNLATITPVDTTAPVHHHERMFRSVIRDPHAGAPVNISPEYMVYLRSAIAAANTEQLCVNSGSPAGPAIRNPRQIKIRGIDATNVEIPLTATIFPLLPQPFITEVYVNTDTVTVATSSGANNPNGFYAIELYNPYPVPVVLTDCDLVAVDKTLGGAYTATPPTVIGTPFLVAENATVPANGYLIIDNLTPSGSASYRPDSSHMRTWAPNVSPTNITILHRPLELAAARELVLRRPCLAPAALAALTPIQQVAAYQPMDSFDFSGTQPLGASRAQIFHYMRPSGTAGAPNPNWRCVYPGRYFVNPGEVLRQQGIDRSDPWDPTAGESEPWSDGDPGIAGHQMVAFGDPGRPSNLPTYTLTGTTAPPCIQLTNNINQAAGRGVLQAAANRFPFGGFAREADLLEVPFIGSYVIQGATGIIYEMNGVSMDAAFAEDTFTEDDEQIGGANQYNSHEQIGRFCPISDITGPPALPSHNDLAGLPANYDPASATNLWNYRWATKLFDYLTVKSNADDYVPNVSELARSTAGLGVRISTDQDGDGIGNGNQIAGVTTENIEDKEPQQGLININTASARVLSSLPALKTGNNWTFNPGASLDVDGAWIDGPDTGATPYANLDDNFKIARDIVRYRDGDPVTGDAPHGPFTSIFDLYRVPAFRNAQQHLLAEVYALPGGPDRTNGDFSDVNDNARNDYEEQFLLLNRISNLITTRSDSFTVYVLVEGWRNIGTTGTPTVAVRRRKAFIQDRWQMTSAGTDLNTPVFLPNE